MKFQILSLRKTNILNSLELYHYANIQPYILMQDKGEIVSDELATAPKSRRASFVARENTMTVSLQLRSTQRTQDSKICTFYISITVLLC